MTDAEGQFRWNYSTTHKNDFLQDSETLNKKNYACIPTDDVEFGSDDVTVRMLMVVIELRNRDTVKDTLTHEDCNSFIGVYLT